MKINYFLFALLIAFASCNSVSRQNVENLPNKQIQFVNLIHRHDSIYNGLANGIGKMEYIDSSRKNIVDFVVLKLQEVIKWQAKLNKLDILKSDSLINAEFLISNIHSTDSILLLSTVPFDSLKLKEQLKTIKINDKVTISGVFISRDVVDLNDIYFTLDEQRKFKTTKFDFYLTDIRK